MILFLNIIILFLNFVIGRTLGYFLGWRGVSAIFFFNLGYIFLNLLFYLQRQLTSVTPIIYETNLGLWVKVGEMEVEWLFLFDRLAICMALMVIIISSLVHFYSIIYMKNEPQLIKFLSYLSLFTAFMFILINSGNFLILFLGWEGVGLCSYLLISFWTTRISAGKAALKALLMNRIGDFFLLIAVCYFFKYFKTVNFEELFVLYPYFDSVKINICGNTIYLKEFLAFLLIFASMGKSAQIGLHTWLPDAMEGPTPVSALIHAATMVTAGIYLLIRCSFFFVSTPVALMFITICGLLTCIVSALIALTQYDLKKIIAYSTCSQLGYMFYSCGVLNFSASLFHLFNHAFFKALLFLAAGAIIHALNGEQDIRKMGSLHLVFPFYYLCFVIATLSLSGFIFFSGYYSKDLIINTYLIQENFLPVTVHQEFRVRFMLWSYWLLIFGVMCTAAYSSRLIYYVFFRTTASLTTTYNSLNKLHKTVPLVYKIIFSILLIFSVFSGWYLRNWFINTLFFSNTFYVNLNNSYIEFIPFYVLNIPVALSIFSALFIFIQYSGKNIGGDSGTFTIFLNRRLYIDSIYNFVISLSVIKISFNIFRYIDKGVIEYFGPLGITQIVFRISEFVDSLHNRQFLWTWYLSISCAMLMVIMVYNLW